MKYINIKNIIKKAKKVNLLVNMKCNLNCICCFNESSNNRYLSIYDLKAITKILNDKEFIITGGEPFLYDSLHNIIELFENKKTTIVTNGTIINKGLLKKIQQYGIELQISIHGFSNKSERLIRNIDCDLIKKNIDIISKYIPKNNISFNYVANKINIEEIPQFLNYCNERGFRRVLITPIVYKGNSIKYWNEIGLDINEKLNLYNKISRLNNEYKNITIIPSGFSIYTNLITNHDIECRHIIEEIVITESGEVILCNPINEYIKKKNIDLNYKDILNMSRLNIEDSCRCLYSNYDCCEFIEK